MSGPVLSLAINGIVILLLAATIFYAVRMSRYLKAFRDNRQELQKLVDELGAQIGKADMAIAGLRQTAKDAGRTLQDRINDARAMSDELQLMTQSGGKVAERMERMSGPPKRDAAQPAARELPPPVKPKRSRDTARELAREALKPPSAAAEAPPAFAIRDSRPDEGEDPDMSRSERELYEALRKPGRSKSNRPTGGNG